MQDVDPELTYHIDVYPDPEGGWVTQVRELPGCMSQGDSLDEALSMIADAMIGWLAANRDMGKEVPQPPINNI